MSEFIKAMLITLGVNAIFLLAALTGEVGFLIFLLLATVLEILFGGIMMFTKDRKRIGAGVAAAGGITLLIGLSVCSTLTFAFH